MANVDQAAIAAALLLEPGDLPDEWYIPAEPHPKGPFTIVEAARELMLFLHRTESKIVSLAVQAEREECAKLLCELCADPENWKEACHIDTGGWFHIVRKGAAPGLWNARTCKASTIRSRASQPAQDEAQLRAEQREFVESITEPQGGKEHTEPGGSSNNSPTPATGASSSVGTSGLLASPCCPKCGKSTLQFMRDYEPPYSFVRCKYGQHEVFPINEVSDFAQFFLPSPESRRELAGRLTLLLMLPGTKIFLHGDGGKSGWKSVAEVAAVIEQGLSR